MVPDVTHALRLAIRLISGSNQHWETEMTESKYGDLSVEIKDYVATVEIHRPPHNFFDVQLIRDLANAFNALDEDPACRISVLCAEGKSFCAGANFANRNATGVEPGAEKRNPLYSEAVRLFSCKKPVVGAIQGAAIGGGLGLGANPPLLHDLCVLLGSGQQPDDGVGVSDVDRQQHGYRTPIRGSSSSAASAGTKAGS